MLTPWDEFLCHQLPTTLDHVSTSDPAWTERIYVSLYDVASKETIFGCGVGQYPNKNVQDGFATVWHQGKQYNILCRRPRAATSNPAANNVEEVTLDLNAMAEGKKFLGLGVYEVSDDGNLLFMPGAGLTGAESDNCGEEAKYDTHQGHLDFLQEHSSQPASECRCRD